VKGWEGEKVRRARGGRKGKMGNELGRVRLRWRYAGEENGSRGCSGEGGGERITYVGMYSPADKGKGQFSKGSGYAQNEETDAGRSEPGKAF
jgi:hypothetical protein